MGWEAPRTKSFKAGEIPGKGRMSGAEAWRLTAGAPKRPKDTERLFTFDKFLDTLKAKLRLK